MDYPHHKAESEEYGHSPGNGTTHIPLSRDPLATEGEATPGPDDYNPYDERERKRAQQRQQNPPNAQPSLDVGINPSPTSGSDPFVFDDAGEVLPELDLPEPRPKRVNLDFL